MRIFGVAIVVPDYDSAIDFYVKRVGFELISDEDQGDGKRWVLVAPKGAATHILLARAVDESQSTAIGAQTGGRVGFFLETEDFASDHARMLKAGVHFEEEPRDEPYGMVAVWRDPYGNRWDLLQFS